MGAAEMETALRQWRQAHPQASWDEIETEVQRQLAGLQATLMAELAGSPREADQPEEAPSCPACGEAMRPCGRRTRGLLTRMGRAVQIERAYYVCPACGAGLFPPG
jgi:hypothetical protein